MRITRLDRSQVDAGGSGDLPQRGCFETMLHEQLFASVKNSHLGGGASPGAAECNDASTRFAR